MNSSQMKNILVLKNLPSNLIDEAFVILKNNKKVKILEPVENKKDSKIQKENSEEYIVKEAEMVISNYLSKVENEKQLKSHSMRQMEVKYKRLKKMTAVLSAIILIDVILEIIGI